MLINNIPLIFRYSHSKLKYFAHKNFFCSRELCSFDSNVKSRNFVYHVSIRMYIVQTARLFARRDFSESIVMNCIF